MTNTVGGALSMQSTNSDVVRSKTVPNCGLYIKQYNSHTTSKQHKTVN